MTTLIIKTNRRVYIQLTIVFLFLLFITVWLADGRHSWLMLIPLCYLIYVVRWKMLITEEKIEYWTLFEHRNIAYKDISLTYFKAEEPHETVNFYLRLKDGENIQLEINFMTNEEAAFIFKYFEENGILTEVPDNWEVQQKFNSIKEAYKKITASIAA